ncbi:MAG: hypothetical protein IIA44_10185 [Acidobacteria bacterium]|nr:hypothetical protein [Acidobacteriota bacterium]
MKCHTLGFQTDNDRRAFHDYVVREAGGKVGDDGTVAALTLHQAGRDLPARKLPD